MAATATTGFANSARLRPRTALVASADGSFRQRLGALLTGLRWKVREAGGGAQAWSEAIDALPQVIIVDSWLPDLELSEFLREFHETFPAVDIVTAGQEDSLKSVSGPHRNEILYALRRTQEADAGPWNEVPCRSDDDASPSPCSSKQATGPFESAQGKRLSVITPLAVLSSPRAIGSPDRIPELIGNSPCMLEVSKRIRRVAARNTPVLIEGPTGSGKELVAEALHRLSGRSRNPFVAINCAAIPEALLEAELFGHTRGAFTGAVQGRVGRIESADGGTLFLDEIGEMPLSLQSKLLRFVESGELQRVGENEAVRVDVRIIAATHQPLAQHTQAGNFRADLYYRLAVFLIRTPSLSEHMEDLDALVSHFLDKLGRTAPIKRIDSAAMAKLRAHSWGGNVRELEHVLERASILAGEEPVLGPGDIDFGILVN